jgi:hemerythrin-like domain-containing protein
MTGEDLTEPQPAARPITRRKLFATGGIALAVGAIGTEIGNLVTGSPAQAPNTDPPDVDLMQEHGVLKRVLLIYQEALRRISIGQQAPTSEIHESAEIIHDFIEEFHEALEEGYVFPTLQRAGKLLSTVDTLYLQHARGRQLTQLILAESATESASSSGIDQMSDAMTAFVRMYQPHEAREDTIVFPTYRAILTADQLNQLGNTFADLQRQQFGPHGFSATVAKVAAIEQRLGIYDLDQFTPNAVTP